MASLASESGESTPRSGSEKNVEEASESTREDVTRDKAVQPNNSEDGQSINPVEAPNYIARKNAAKTEDCCKDWVFFARCRRLRRLAPCRASRGGAKSRAFNLCAQHGFAFERAGIFRSNHTQSGARHVSLDRRSDETPEHENSGLLTWN